MKNIAVLITSYNRVDITLECLEKLYNAELSDGFSLDVYLVDDASPDETGRLVKERFPKVNVIQGTGDLYWCGGMRLAWETAANTEDYDFYLWLNDDTLLMESALITLFQDYETIKKTSSNKSFAICGACKEPDDDLVSYSGTNTLEPVKLLTPDEKSVLECKYMCGNVVLISRNTFLEVGGITNKIRHRFGDYDYSVRINNAGGQCFISSSYTGLCHNQILKCFDVNVSLFKRVTMFYSPVGLGLFDDILFKKKLDSKFRQKWVLNLLKKHIMCFFPKQYKALKKYFNKH